MSEKLGQNKWLRIGITSDVGSISKIFILPALEIPL